MNIDNSLYRFGEFDNLFKVAFSQKCKNNGKFTLTLRSPNQIYWLAFFDNNGILIEQQQSTSIFPYQTWSIDITQRPNLQNKCTQPYLFERQFTGWDTEPAYILEPVEFGVFEQHSEIAYRFFEPQPNVPANFEHYIYLFLLQKSQPKRDNNEYTTSDGTTKKLSQFNTLESVYQCELIPAFMAEIMNNALSADSVKINNVNYVVNEMSYDGNLSESTFGAFEFTAVRQNYNVKNLNII